MSPNIDALKSDSFLYTLAGIMLVCLTALIGFSLITGTFVPLQTSEVTTMGICTQNQSLEIVTMVSDKAEVLYICGILTGPTRRSARFNLYFDGNMVFSSSQNWYPGVFFIPVEASRLRYVDSSVFPSGSYRLEVAYARDPALSFSFDVNAQ